ncbi:MAG: hypothetical protein J6S71_07775 [Clostridia bacterium]|nr:hypothetical protein [Clostridia bacterium]
MKETTLNSKTVLLEALEYIDRDLIAETVEELKAPPMRQAPERDKSVTRKSIKYTLLLAACLVLVSAIIPVVNYVLTHFDILPGWNPGSDTTTETTEATAETTEIAEVPSGYDYVLTEEDLEMMNKAYKEKYLPNLKNYIFFESIDWAMKRTPPIYYYFGKYGDTIVIWYNYDAGRKCCFNINGYDFDFYVGSVYFIRNGILYDHIDIPEGLLTTDEAKTFHEDFTEYLIPVLQKEYKVLNFTENLEHISLDEMKKINDAYDSWQYELYYAEGLELFQNNANYEEQAVKYACRQMYFKGYNPHKFFHEDLIKEYAYYGKVNNKVILAVQDSITHIYTKQIGDYKFIFNKTTSIYVYCDGVFEEFEAAYTSGVISAEELAFIYERHCAYYNYFVEGYKEEPIPDKLKIIDSTKPSPIELTLDEKREIAWEYIESEYDLDYSYGVRCYGKFENVYAVMIDGPYVYSSEMRGENVAGYTFTFTSGQQMYVYKEGEFYSLLEAYLREIITEENVTAIEWDKTPQ